jgi:hypothetical protein
MSRCEYASIKSKRAAMIDNGEQIFCDYDGLTTSIEIADRELSVHKCPLSIVRHMGNDFVEIISANNLIVPISNK